jgi:hypothetical protein
MTADSLLIIAALGFVLAIPFVAAELYERAEMFKPTREHALTPSDVGLPPPREMFIDSGGAKLYSWFFQTSPSATTLLYVHGNAGNMADRLRVIKGYLSLGLNVFIYDPRGYGKSEGVATPDNFIRDALSAYSHLVDKSGVHPSQIVVLGQSLGGIAALRLVNGVKCRGLILEGAFASVRWLARDRFPNLPVWVFVLPRLDNEREIRKLSVPVLLISGALDDTIPPRHSKLLFESAPEPRELLVVDGAAHSDMYSVAPELYYGAIGRFVKQQASDAVS